MIYTFLAEGFEEMEAFAPVDILRRAKIEVKTVGVAGQTVVGASGIKVQCDLSIDEANENNLDGIILPGGMPGTENLFKNEKVKNIVENCAKENKLIGAICAAPIILGKLGLLKGKKACCYPGCEKELEGAEIVSDRVCAQGNIITGKGPGACIEFSLELLKNILGERKTAIIKQSMQ